MVGVCLHSKISVKINLNTVNLFSSPLVCVLYYWFEHFSAKVFFCTVFSKGFSSCFSDTNVQKSAHLFTPEKTDLISSLIINRSSFLYNQITCSLLDWFLDPDMTSKRKVKLTPKPTSGLESYVFPKNIANMMPLIRARNCKSSKN